MHMYTCSYQRGRNVNFSENLSCILNEWSSMFGSFYTWEGYKMWSPFSPSLGLVDIRRYRSITSVGKVLPMTKIKILGEVKEFLKFLVIKCVENMKLRPKLCGKCIFPKNFHTRKLGEITVFFVVHIQTTISEDCW